MEYQLEMVYERKDIAALVKALDYRRRPEKNLRLATKIGYPIFGLLLIFSGISAPVKMLQQHLTSPLTVVVSLACFIGGILLIRRSDTRAMERRSWRKYPNKGVTMIYTFYNDHFEEKDDVSGESSYQYSSVKSANEDANHIFLFSANNSAHILKKQDFTVGDPQKFADFIRRKASVSIDPIN